VATTQGVPPVAPSPLLRFGPVEAPAHQRTGERLRELGPRAIGLAVDRYWPEEGAAKLALC
jgi:hypothetical protein